MHSDSRIFVAGHRGLVGSAIVRRLEKGGYTNIITRTHKELDLTNQLAVREFFELESPEYVFLAAAKVGGIHANATYPADFILNNLQIQSNVISAAKDFSAKKLMFLGSSCIYPKFANQPITEDQLLTGTLEPTNEAYAIAKIAGIKLCRFMNQQHGTNFMAAMPTNLYGPNDNFDLETSHVLPALIRKCHDAKISHCASVTIWGTGTPRREFLHVDDLADAVVYLMENYGAEDLGEFVNIGTGEDLPIIDLAHLVAKVVGFEGQIISDSSKPDGTPRKVMDVSRVSRLGWKASIELEPGVAGVYKWAVEEGLLPLGTTTV